MKSDTEIQAALSMLRSGEATRRDAFFALVGAGCSCLSAVELITEAAGGSESDGAGAEAAQGRAGASAGTLDAAAIPIFYGGFVVQTTTRCNAKCAMCYQSAGPRGSDLMGKAQLTFEEIARLIVEASGIDTIASRFHLSGGESFLDVDGCVELFRVARAAGFLDVMTTTNAYWAQAEERARDICLRLKEAGLTRMEISWDFWHLPWIRPLAVANCIRGLPEPGHRGAASRHLLEVAQLRGSARPPSRRRPGGGRFRHVRPRPSDGPRRAGDGHG